MPPLSSWQGLFPFYLFMTTFLFPKDLSAPRLTARISPTFTPTLLP
jgi:hypothetical protein